MATAEFPKFAGILSAALSQHHLPYVKQIASPGSMHETGCSGLVHWDDPEGWGGEGRGRRVQDGGHMYTRGGFKSMYGKKHHNIVK